MNPLFLVAALGGLVLVLLIIRYPLLGIMLIVAVNPFDYMLSQDLSVAMGRPLGVLVALGWLGRVVVSKRRTALTQQPFPNLLLLSFIAVMVAATAWSIVPEAGFPTVVTIGLLIAMAMFLQDFIETREDLLRLVWAIALVMGISAVLGVVQFRELQSGAKDVVGHYDAMRSGYRVSGLQKNPNGFALMVMSGLPFLLFLMQHARRLAARLGVLVLLVFSAAAIFMTVSRTHVLALFVFVLTYFALRLRSGRLGFGSLVLFLGMGAMLASMLLFLPEFVYQRLVVSTLAGDMSTVARYHFFLKALDLVSSYPMLGVGVGAFSYYDPYRGMNPHDVFSFVLAGTGLLGTVVLSAIVLDSLLRMGLNIRRFARTGDTTMSDLATVILAAFLTMLVSGGGQIFLFQRMFWIYVGVSLALSRLQKTLERRAAEEDAAGLLGADGSDPAGGPSP